MSSLRSYIFPAMVSTLVMTLIYGVTYADNTEQERDRKGMEERARQAEQERIAENALRTQQDEERLKSLQYMKTGVLSDALNTHGTRITCYRVRDEKEHSLEACLWRERGMIQVRLTPLGCLNAPAPGAPN